MLTYVGYLVYHEVYISPAVRTVRVKKSLVVAKKCLSPLVSTGGCWGSVPNIQYGVHIMDINITESKHS
jgi:hypothetical protein